MDFPEQIDLPFFAYGIFKPGQLGYLRLKDFVDKHEPGSVKGELMIRDGLPILKEGNDGKVRGELLHFTDGDNAYRRIVDIEPDKQYFWRIADISKVGDDEVKANVLFGKKPDKGTINIQFEASIDWDGSKDSLFNDALDVVKEIIDENPKFEFPQNVKAFYRFQMAYMLLWSSIERYASLRYHLGTNVWQKVKEIANEPAFREALRNGDVKPRSIQRADEPEKKISLEPDNPRKSIEYYYQVRSNMVHRGKSAYEDLATIKQSLVELYNIICQVKEAAFDESRSFESTKCFTKPNS